MPDVAQVHHVLDTVLNTMAIVLNLALLYLILKYSTFQAKVYKYVLLVTCVSDITLATIMWVAQPVILFSGGYSVLHANGFFAKNSRLFDWFCVSAVCSGVHANLVVLCTQFYCRYRFICHRDNNPKGMVIVKMVLLPAVWCVIQGYSAFWFNYQTPEYSSIGLEALRNNSWPYDANNPPPVFGSFVEQPRVFFYVGCYIATASLGYYLIIWCEMRIMKFIKLLGGSVSENTKQMHSDVHKALIALAAAPFFTSVVPIWFFMISVVSRASPGQVSAFMIFGCSSITVINPLTTAYFVKPYRYAILKMFGLYKARTAPLQTVVTGALSLAPTSQRMETIEASYEDFRFR